MNRDQSLADGTLGVALLHMETGNRPAAAAALRHAVAGGVSIAPGASLFYGAPALAFVLATSNHPRLAQARATAADGTATVTRRRLDTAHRRIDRHSQPDYAEYDLIRGLTGLGVTLRRLGNRDLLRHVLDYLVRLTQPLGALPGWWCTNGPDRTQPANGGHANFGIADGITGPLALLALTARDGITVDGHTEAITHICRWMDTWQQHTDGITWWPQTITRTDLHRGTPARHAPPRPSWCYGTPGIARAQQLAAHALRDAARQHRAEAAFTAVTDPAQLRRLADRSLCHGTAGLLATARRITADAVSPYRSPRSSTSIGGRPLPPMNPTGSSTARQAPTSRPVPRRRPRGTPASCSPDEGRTPWTNPGGNSSTSPTPAKPTSNANSTPSPTSAGCFPPPRLRV